MAYRPLLGMGADYSLMDWQVIATMVTTTLGLVAFAAGIDRYFIRLATVLETGLFVGAAAGLFWPGTIYNVIGLALLLAAVVLQKFYTPAAAKA